MSTVPQPSSRSRSWPEPGQFNEAVQNLATTMSDRELQGGEPELTALGLPSPYAGNFADVYKVHCPQTGNTWAVKFFKREVRDLRERYRAISDQLIIAQLPFMTEFRYIEDGVRIGGAWYPLVKMRWIEGQSLSRFVAQSLFQPRLLDQLFELWVKLATRLRGAGIAHADLQHGNVVLVPHGDQGKLLLKLIDYDGMFVPALAGQGSSELGHANYQHPQREATRAYHAELDRFSHLAICTALRCLSVGGLPLWERFNTDDNVLFTSRDYADPANSKLFRELWMLRNRDAHSLVGHLALATQRPLEQAPLMDDLVRDGQVRPLTAAEQQDVDDLLAPTDAVTTAAMSAAPVATTVDTPPPVRHAAAAVAAAVPVAEVAAPPAAVPAAQEPVEATLAPSFSVLALAALPFLMFDRLLALLAGGAQNALLHNFFRMIAVGAAVGGPVALYASGLWRDKSPPPVSPPIVLLPEETPDPEENPPEPEPEPTPEPEISPDPAKDPFVIESTTPDPMPKPTPVKPMPMVPTPPAISRQRPFEELERSSDGLALVKLPLYSEGPAGATTLLAQLHIDRPEDLELKLLGAIEVFSLARRVELQPNDAALSPGKLRSWVVTRSRSEAGDLLATKERIGEFSLGADQKLAFTWGSGSLVKPLGALRYCLLELKVPTESVVCALSTPVEIALPKWSFNEITGIASLPLPELETTTLPPVDRLRVDLSLGAGRRVGAEPFQPDVRKESSTAGTELSSGSARYAFSDGGSTLFEVKAALSFDPQSSASGRLVLAPEFIKNIYKPEGVTPEATLASSTRLAKLRTDCEAEVKRIAGKRDSRKRLIDVEKWNQQLVMAQDKYTLADEAMLNAQTPSAMATAERRLESAAREVEKFQKLLDDRAAEDQQSFDLQSFAEDNRDRCDRALFGMNQLQQTTLGLRLYYEVDVNSTRRQIDILRTAGIVSPKKPSGPGRTKGKGRP